MFDIPGPPVFHPACSLRLLEPSRLDRLSCPSLSKLLAVRYVSSYFRTNCCLRVLDSNQPVATTSSVNRSLTVLQRLARYLAS